MSYRFLVVVAIFVSIAGCGSSDEVASSWQVPDLSIGVPDLKQDVVKRDVVEGVEFYDILRGEFGGDSYILSSGVLDSAAVGQYMALLKRLAIDYSLESAAERAPQGNQIGDILRIRSVRNRQDAEDLSRKLQENGLIFNVVYSAQEGLETTGPFKISLLKIDLNQFDGRIVNSLAQKTIQGAETVSAMSVLEKSVAGINGGYFVFNDEVGDYGAPAGIYVDNGVLLREASNDRPVLIVDNSGDKTNIIFGRSVRTELFLKQGNQYIQLNGLNRKPGLLLNCGGYEGRPLMEPAHDFLCTSSNEVIAFDRNYGAFTPVGDVSELILSPDGSLVDFSKSSGTEIKEGHTYIQFSGNKFFDFNQQETMELVQRVYVDGKEFQLKPGISMVSGGPTLILDGKLVDGLRARQGWNPFPRKTESDDQNTDENATLPVGIENREAFYGNWVLRRHPRTAIGLTAGNILYMAVVYGRNPGVSEGATITEMSNLMKALGVDHAMNLDGGGSSIMVLNDQPTGPFSDPQERMVSDAIFLVANE